MKLLISTLFVVLLIICMPADVNAEALTAPPVPQNVEHLMPQGDYSFADSVLEIMQKMIPYASGALHAAAKSCLAVFGCTLLVSILQSTACSAAETVGGVCIAMILTKSSRSLIGLSMETINEIYQYCKLFLPVITTAVSARGSVSSSAAMYVGTSAFTVLLNAVLCEIMFPLVHLYLAAAIGNCVIGEASLKRMKDQMKKLSTWLLKSIVGVFLTYMTVVGAVSGSADQSAIKAVKTAVAAVVPVIGKTLADASEALLVSADIVKNSIGIYGIFAFLAIFLSPFIKLGIQYLLLKATASLCAILGSKRVTELIDDFCGVLALLLAMVGSMCVMCIIGTVCFMKGASS